MPMGRKHQFAVGVFVMLSLIAAVTLVFIFGETDALKKTYQLECHMTSVGGPVRRGAPVRMMGLDIGRVESVSLTTGSEPEVILTLKIFDSFQILDDSYLHVELDGIVGDRVLQIEPGTKGDLLKNGDHVRGESPISIEKTIDQVQKTIIKIDSLVVEANETFSIFNKLVGEPGFIEDVHGLAHESHASVQKIQGVLESIDDFSKSFQQEISTLSQSTQNLLEPAKDVVRKVKEGQGSLGRLVSEEEFFDNLQDTLSTMRRVIGGIKDNPSQLFWGSDDEGLVRKLSLNDIDLMKQAGLDSKTIAAQIRACGQKYALSADRLIELKNKGYEDSVLEALVTN